MVKTWENMIGHSEDMWQQDGKGGKQSGNMRKHGENRGQQRETCENIRK